MRDFNSLSDDGTLPGRGHPWLRGAVCGLTTTLGGIGPTRYELTCTNFRPSSDLKLLILQTN